MLQIGFLDHIQLADSNSENPMFLALLLIELLHFEYGCGYHVATDLTLISPFLEMVQLREFSFCLRKNLYVVPQMMDKPI